jgi:medium-chain acyl-[acyl-carrier-protein] hydrolase
VGRIGETPIVDFRELLSSLTDALRPEMEIPVALFGHSLGALLAFELAREMCDRTGGPPLHLFVSGHNAPDVTDELDDVAGLDDAAMVGKLRDLGCTAEAVLRDRETMQLMLPILRADFALCRSYAYRDSRPLGCPVTVFHGREDPQTDAPGLEGWRRQTTGLFRMQLFSGNHFFIATQEQLVVQSIACELQRHGFASDARHSSIEQQQQAG